jgi:hypothetical protein
MKKDRKIVAKKRRQDFWGNPIQTMTRVIGKTDRLQIINFSVRKEYHATLSGILRRSHY